MPLLTKAGGRRQGTVFVTGIYAPLHQLFALKGEVLDLIFSIMIDTPNGLINSLILRWFSSKLVL
jgi:hypothetical protein